MLQTYAIQCASASGRIWNDVLAGGWNRARVNIGPVPKSPGSVMLDVVLGFLT
jgi:hypothetical protein